MGGRVVEGTGLENRQARKGLVGSNPTPSAKHRSYAVCGGPRPVWIVKDRARYALGVSGRVSSCLPMPKPLPEPDLRAARRIAMSVRALWLGAAARAGAAAAPFSDPAWAPRAAGSVIPRRAGRYGGTWRGDGLARAAPEGAGAAAEGRAPPEIQSRAARRRAAKDQAAARRTRIQIAHAFQAAPAPHRNTAGTG